MAVRNLQAGIGFAQDVFLGEENGGDMSIAVFMLNNGRMAVAAVVFAVFQV